MESLLMSFCFVEVRCGVGFLFSCFMKIRHRMGLEQFVEGVYSCSIEAVGDERESYEDLLAVKEFHCRGKKNCCQGCWILVVDGALSHWRVGCHLRWIKEVILDVVDDDQ
ncbi:hypothetical protein Droror1_Dr00013276 [Drosera rotundifolia]